MTFKAYFTRNKEVLINVLSDFLPLPTGSTIMDVHTTNQEMIPREIKVKNKDKGKKEGKLYILDIKAKIKRKDNKWEHTRRVGEYRNAKGIRKRFWNPCIAICFKDA